MKRVLVTCTNKGIGYEIAKQLSKKDFHVLLGARDINRGKAAANEINSLEGKVIRYEYAAGVFPIPEEQVKGKELGAMKIEGIEKAQLG